MPILIKLIIDCACGALNSWGGFCFLAARRYIMPCILAVAVSIQTHIFWTGFLVLPVIGTLVLGYKDFGSGHFSRGMWLFVQYTVAGIGLFLTHHFSWYFYFPYCILGGVLGGTLVNVFQPIGDAIEGCFLGVIILCVH